MSKILNCIWWWGSSSGDPRSVDYTLLLIFVAASHQTGLYTRSMTRRSINVRIRGGGSVTNRGLSPAGLWCISPTRTWPSRSREPYGLKSAFVGLRRYHLYCHCSQDRNTSCKYNIELFGLRIIIWRYNCSQRII